MTSPTQKSLEHMKQQGYMCAIVERWNSHAKIRQDLYGFIDILGVGSNGTIAVQTTSTGEFTRRIQKITGTLVPKDKKEEDRLLSIRSCVLACLSAGWVIEVHGWDSKVKHAAPRIKTITVNDLVSPHTEIEEQPF